LSEYMKKTIIFDLGWVYFTDWTKHAIETISKIYNISQENVKNVLKWELGTKYRIGELTAEEFWSKAKEFRWLNVPSAELANIWLEEYKPIPGTAKIIDRLNKALYEIIFLSDNVQERIDYLQAKYPFLDKFKWGVFSHLVKTRKPDPKIYELALNEASNKAGECIYIDDKLELLEPAKLMWMKTIHFQTVEDLEKSLKDLGLKF